MKGRMFRAIVGSKNPCGRFSHRICFDTRSSHDMGDEMARPRKTENAPRLFNFEETHSPKEAFRNIRNYLAGQFVGATRDDTLLDEVLKCLFCKLVLESEGGILPEDSIQIAKQVRTIFAKVKKRFPEIYSIDDEILLDPDSINMIMGELSFSVMDAVSDPVGDAFEIFVGSESKGNAGQFFTPRSVTNLLVEALQPCLGETVLDPACGAGGFLTSTCAHLYRTGATAEDVSKWVQSSCYGIDKDDHLAKLAKVHISLLTGAHPNIVCGDSLAMQNGGKALQDCLPTDGVDVLLTNPPFGVKIIAAKPELLKTFEVAKKWRLNKKSRQLEPTDIISSNVPPQVLFIERSLSLVKPGGRLGLVVPESLLSNKSYRHVVEFIMRNADIQSVIGMPEALFKTSGKGGTHTKTCLVVARKFSKTIISSKTVFMAEAKWCGQDSRARVIPHNDLPEIAQRLKTYQSGVEVKPTNLGFVMNKIDITDGVLCPRYYDPQATTELDALSQSHRCVKFGDLVRDGVLAIATGDEIGKLAYGTGPIPFIRTSDISNWELKSDPKHGVSREIYSRLSLKQDVRVGDVLMVRDGTYLIGTCAIVTEADAEMLYQSHLFKIRVNENNLGLNPYLLLALLSSPAVQKQIRSKQFTMDIIDSLGDRIHELILPIPAQKQTVEDITKMVDRAVSHRIEARKLAQAAREAISAN